MRGISVSELGPAPWFLEAARARQLDIHDRGRHGLAFAVGLSAWLWDRRASRHAEWSQPPAGEKFSNKFPEDDGKIDENRPEASRRPSRSAPPRPRAPGSRQPRRRGRAPAPPRTPRGENGHGLRPRARKSSRLRPQSGAKSLWVRGAEGHHAYGL